MAEEHIIRFEDRHNLGLKIYEASEVKLRYSTTFTGGYDKEYENEENFIQ